jgi:hypothetical protein
MHAKISSATGAATGMIVMHTAGLESAGLILTGADSPDFDDILHDVAPDLYNELLEAKPFVVVVSNISSHTVVAYSVCFRITHMTIGGLERHVHFVFPDAVAGMSANANPLPRGREVLPGQKRVVGFGVEFCPDSDRSTVGYSLQAVANLAPDPKELDIQLEAALFENGVMVSPDSMSPRDLSLRDDFMGRLEADQKLYQLLVSHLDAGMSVDEAFRAETDLPPPKGRVERPEYQLRQSIATARRCRQIFGDKAIGDVLRQAVRATPFVVRSTFVKDG